MPGNEKAEEHACQRNSMMGPGEGRVWKNGQGVPWTWSTGAGAGEAGSRGSSRAPLRAVN